jgi:hypothetical protein
MNTFDKYQCGFDKEVAGSTEAELSKGSVELFDILRLLENRMNAKTAVDEAVKDKGIDRMAQEVLEVGIKDLDADISMLRELIGDRTMILEGRERLLTEVFDEIVEYAHSGQESDSRKLRKHSSEEFSQDLIDYVENRDRMKDRLLEAIKTRVDGEFVELFCDDLSLKLEDDRSIINGICRS